MNIIDIIIKLLGRGDIVSKIASLLGTNQDQAGKGINAAVPALLAGLAAVAKKSSGADALAKTISSQDPGILDDVGGFLGKGDAAAKGGNLLSSLLGGEGLGRLGGVLSQFTGIGQEGSGKLLGLLGPVVLGAIGKSAPKTDAGGIANFLASQSGNISSALPSGLGKMLSSAIPGVGDLLGGASETVGATARSTIHAAHGGVRQAEKAGSSFLKWLIPAILAVLAILFLPKMCRQADDAGRAVADMANPAAEGTRLVSEATEVLQSATESISSIKDEASATAALPKLRELTTKIGSIETVFAKLPASVQSTVRASLRPLIAKLREAAQPVLGLPVVGAQVKPVLDEMFAGLERLVPSA
jgi:hypothetical protein